MSNAIADLGSLMACPQSGAPRTRKEPDMSSRTDPPRRRVLAASAGVALATVFARFPRLARAADEPLETRPIPHGGEQLPIVGIGTAIIFDFQNRSEEHTSELQS